MPLPPVPPAVIVECPLRDTTHARLAGDSAGRRVSVANHTAVGITTGVVGGISGLIAATANRPAALATFLVSTVIAGTNVAIASGSTGVASSDARRIVDCDSTLIQAYRSGYGERAKAKRGRWAFWSTIVSYLAGAAALFGLVLAVLLGGNWD